MERRQHRVLLVTTTRYDDVGDGNVRWALGQRTAAEARTAGHDLIVVDGSPAGPVADTVTAVLSGHGAVVLRQQDTTHGGSQNALTKGGALRQALAAAAARLLAESQQADTAATTAATLVAFQEPEKWSLVAHWRAIAASALPDSSSPTASVPTGVIVIPERTPSAWATYPSEQQHSEHFGNAHLHNLLRSAASSAAAAPPALDWFFGPFAVSVDLLPYFAAYDGAWWDAQIVPLLRAWRNGSSQILVGVPVDFVCDQRQRTEEEGSVAYGKKRLHQLHYLFPLFEQELTRA